MFKKISLPFLGFLQATGLVVYLVLISLFFNFVSNNANLKTMQFYGPIMMLLLFIVSAVLSALLVLGRAGMLFWEKKYADSLKLLLSTVGWGIFYLAFFTAVNVSAN